MKNVVLVGNPNVGKSLLFSRITGIGVISSNYAGSTIALKKGNFSFDKNDYELFDAPGIYLLESFSQSDAAALAVIDNADVIVNVVDATSLERNLNITLQLLAKKKPMVVCLNFWDDTSHKGVFIDAVKLEQILGVEVVPASALSGEGIPALVASIGRARAGRCSPDNEDPWRRIGAIVNSVQKLTHRHHTLAERIADFTIHPVGGLLSALFVLAATFSLVRFAGEGLAAAVCSPAYTRAYQPFIFHLTSNIPYGAVREILSGHSADPLESFGLLTTGVYIALVLVFPYFLSFYFLFGFLEDIGYLPRLAVVLDTIFHRLGLHGYSSIPVMLGLGCKVPAFMATRVLTNRREKILTMALILMSAPCLPQSAMIISLGMHYGMGVVLAIFFILFAMALAANAIMNRIFKGEAQELFIEIPPYRMPSIPMMAGKLKLRTVEYLQEVFPMIAAGVLLMSVLQRFNILNVLANVIGKPLALLLGLPHEIAPVMLLGFLRKDVSIALLAPFHLSAPQFIIASIFMVLYVPCVASFFTLMKELGVGTTVKVAGLVFISAVSIAGFLNAAFMGLRVLMR